MWEYIKRNADGIEIGAFFFLLTVMVAYLIFRRQKTPKTLDYAILSHQLFITPQSKLHFIWTETDNIGDGWDVIRPSITYMRIANTGRQEIDQSDFLEPIEVVPARPDDSRSR